MQNSPDSNTSLLPLGEASVPVFHLPTVEYAAGLEQLADVRVDPVWFADLMTQKGMAGPDIADSTIRMITDLEIEEGQTPAKGDARVDLGGYDPPTRTAEVSIPAVKEVVDYIEQDRGDAEPFEAGEADEMMSWFASQTGVHEVLHRIEDALDQRDQAAEDAYYAELVPEKFWGKVFRNMLRKSSNPSHHQAAEDLRAAEISEAQLNPQFEHYHNSPRERRIDRLVDEIMEQLEPEDYPIQVRLK